MNDTARPACEQWGLPDWHDESKYPDHKVVSILTWCWEFLRRSPAYREFWKQKVVLPRQRRSPLEVLLDEPLSKEGFDKSRRVRIIDGGHAYGMHEAKQRFGLMRAYDPRQSDCQASFRLDGTTVYTGGNLNPDTLGDEILMSFNLNLPIQPQLERAKVILTHKQFVRDLPTELRQTLKGESFQSYLRRLDRATADLKRARPRRELRLHTEKFASYLRVLDAKEVGASNPVIAAILSPNLSKADGVKSVVNHYRAARRIRDNDYRLYAALADEGRT